MHFTFARAFRLIKLDGAQFKMISIKLNKTKRRTHVHKRIASVNLNYIKLLFLAFLHFEEPLLIVWFER